MKRLQLIYLAVYIISSALTAQPLHLKSISQNLVTNMRIKPELFVSSSALLNNNDIGNVTQEVWQKWSEVTSQYDNSAQYLNRYDSITGKLIESVYQIWDGVRWINDNQYIYYYDQNGQLNMYEYYEWNGNNWKHIGTGEFSDYNASGNYGEESYREKIDGDFEYKSRYNYTYDFNNNLIEYSSLYFENDEWQPFDWYKYEYTGNCKILSIGYLWDDTEYILADQMEFNYDFGCFASIPYAKFWWLYDGSP